MTAWYRFQIVYVMACSPRSALHCPLRSVVRLLFCIFTINNAGTYPAGATIQKCSTDSYLRAAGHSQHLLPSSCAAQDVEVLELIRDGGMWMVGRADLGAAAANWRHFLEHDRYRARGALPRPVRAV